MDNLSANELTTSSCNFSRDTALDSPANAEEVSSICTPPNTSPPNSPLHLEQSTFCSTAFTIDFGPDDNTSANRLSVNDKLSNWIPKTKQKLLERREKQRQMPSKQNGLATSVKSKLNKCRNISEVRQATKRKPHDCNDNNSVYHQKNVSEHLSSVCASDITHLEDTQRSSNEPVCARSHGSRNSRTEMECCSDAIVASDSEAGTYTLEDTVCLLESVNIDDRCRCDSSDMNRERLQDSIEKSTNWVNKWELRANCQRGTNCRQDLHKSTDSRLSDAYKPYGFQDIPEAIITESADDSRNAQCQSKSPLSASSTVGGCVGSVRRASMPAGVKPAPSTKAANKTEVKFNRTLSLRRARLKEAVNCESARRVGACKQFRQSYEAVDDHTGGGGGGAGGVPERLSSADHHDECLFRRDGGRFSMRVSKKSSRQTFRQELCPDAQQSRHWAPDSTGSDIVRFRASALVSAPSDRQDCPIHESVMGAYSALSLSRSHCAATSADPLPAAKKMLDNLLIASVCSLSSKVCVDAQRLIHRFKHVFADNQVFQLIFDDLLHTLSNDSSTDGQSSRELGSLRSNLRSLEQFIQVLDQVLVREIFHCD